MKCSLIKILLLLICVSIISNCSKEPVEENLHYGIWALENLIYENCEDIDDEESEMYSGTFCSNMVQYCESLLITLGQDNFYSIAEIEGEDNDLDGYFDEVGTYILDGNSIELCENIDECYQFTMELIGDRMIWSGSGEDFDFCDFRAEFNRVL